MLWGGGGVGRNAGTALKRQQVVVMIGCKREWKLCRWRCPFQTGPLCPHRSKGLGYHCYQHLPGCRPHERQKWSTEPLPSAKEGLCFSSAKIGRRMKAHKEAAGHKARCTTRSPGAKVLMCPFLKPPTWLLAPTGKRDAWEKREKPLFRAVLMLFAGGHKAHVAEAGWQTSPATYKSVALAIWVFLFFFLQGGGSHKAMQACPKSSPWVVIWDFQLSFSLLLRG